MQQNWHLPKSSRPKDNSVPFYAALPKSTIDIAIFDGVRGIPIGESENEVTHSGFE